MQKTRGKVNLKFNFTDFIFSFEKYLGSPYAKPNKWGIAELRRDIKQRREEKMSLQKA